jgi:transcriptional regulator with XRE-family HTH domain
MSRQSIAKEPCREERNARLKQVPRTAQTVSASQWNASQLVAYNLARARHKAGMTQQQAADAISLYTDCPWSQSAMATAEISINGNRIRQFSASELLAFSFVFDVPVQWFFTPPPPEHETVALHMPNHPDGIGWDWVFRRLGPTESNIYDHLRHEGRWHEKGQYESDRRPAHASTSKPVIGAALHRAHCAAAFRRQLFGPRNPVQQRTGLSDAEWFDTASGVMTRIAEMMKHIGTDMQPDVTEP